MRVRVDQEERILQAFEKILETACSLDVWYLKIRGALYFTSKHIASVLLSTSATAFAETLQTANLFLRR